MTTDESTCLTLLNLIIGKLQPYEKSSLEEKYQEVRHFLTEDFDKTDFFSLPKEIQTLENISSEQKEGIFVYFLDSKNEQRYLAKFVAPAPRNDWKMSSLIYGCPCCFGEGVNNGETCILCGGSGWGSV